MKTTVNYGVIKDLEVTIPDGSINAVQLVEAFAEAYVKHITSGGLVSDDVLISSISASHLQHAMIEGCERYGKAFQDAVRLTAEGWSVFVLMARYGKRKGFVKDSMRNGFSEADARKLAAVIPE